MNKKTVKKNTTLLYQAPSGEIEFHGDFQHETIWANLNQIAQLFDVQKSAISKHIKNIYETGELQKTGTVSILETVQKEGTRSVVRHIETYNLDFNRY